MTEKFAVNVQNLKKRFGEIQAVNDVSFAIRAGEIFSLLGPNGAGKTTTISMISQLLKPDSGEIQVMGHPLRSEAMAAHAGSGLSRRISPSILTFRRVRTFSSGARCITWAAPS